MATEKRLIDAYSVIKKIDNYYNNSPFPHPGTTWLRGLELATGLLLAEPTVDAVEVVHGRWVHDSVGFDDFWTCSACGEDWFFIDDPEAEYTKVNYCPNCGADMRERKDNE